MTDAKIKYAQPAEGTPFGCHLKEVAKYLNRTKEMFLVYGGDEELVVKGYVDASFDTDLDEVTNRIRVYFEWWGSKLVQLQAKRRGGIYM